VCRRNGVAKTKNRRTRPKQKVEPFLLPPADSGAGAARRRAVLLARAVDYATIGIPRTDWPETMSKSEML
jgi:hypothetical protein